MKKVLSLVLVIAMVLSSMSFAFAAKFEDIADTDYAEAVDTLAALGVITGYEDGTFRPEKTVTRAEMAKMMVITLGYGDLVAGSKSNFADTQGHWADSYIALAAGKGIVVGTGAGKFDPDRTVSYNEAVTMLVRGLGYTDSCNELKGMTWPTNFKVKAAELGITKNVKLTNNGADRGGVAQLIKNALKSGLVTVDTDGNVTTIVDNYTKDGKNYSVVRPLLSRLAERKTIDKVTADYLDKDSKLYAGNIVDLAPYMYQEIEVYVNDDDEVVYVNDVKSDVLVGEFRRTANDDGSSKADDKINVRIDGKNKEYKLNSTTATSVYYNGVEISLSEAAMEAGTATVTSLHKAKATFVLNDKKEVTGIIAEKYTAASRIATVYNGKTKLEGYMLPLNDDDKPDYDKLTVRGAVTKLEDIKEDDVVVLFAGAGLVNAKTTEPEKLIIEVVRDVVEGKITETNSDGDFLINGKYYPASVYAPANLVEVGDQGKFFLDTKGAILDFEEGTESSPVDYAVVVEVLNGYKVGERVIAEPQIKLVNVKGEEITYDIKTSAKIKVNGVESNLLAANEMDVLTLLNTNNTVVKYSINSKNEITAITVVKAVAKSTNPTTTTDTTKASFVMANNVTVFNFDGEDVEVVDKAKLGDDVKVLAKETNKNGQIEMLFVRGLGASDTYAFITSAGTAINSDDVKVQKLTAYVNGAEKTYLTDKLDTVTKPAIDAFKIVKLNLDGDVVEGTTDVATVNGKATQLIANKTEVTRVSGNRVRIGADTWYTLASDVAVYVLDADEFDSVGSASSVYTGAKVAGYAFDEDNIDDKVIEILFIFE